MTPPDPRLAVFQAERRRLAGLGYRMTGSVAETDDILQQAWLRLSGQDLETIEDPPRWLSTVVTRLCLDHLRSARHRRERYVGAWLPEPLLRDSAPGAEQDWIAAEDVGIALLLLLDALTPEMRAAFLLRDAFDYGFDEIAEVVGRSPAACRQLVSRARRRVAGGAPPDMGALETAAPIAQAFWRASREGDMQALLDLFAQEIELRADGGGKAPAALNILHGRRRVAGLLCGLARKRAAPAPSCPPLRRVNGAPGFLSVEAGGVRQVTVLGLRGGKIAAIWIMRNPDKLRHVA